MPRRADPSAGRPYNRMPLRPRIAHRLASFDPTASNRVVPVSVSEPSSAVAPSRVAAALPALVPEPPKVGQRLRCVPLAGSADALALAQLASRAASERRTVTIVCADALAMRRLAEEIAWFAPSLRIAQLPDWETLPYDHFSPHHDLVSERLATLYRIMREDFDVAIVPAATALTRLAPPSFLAAHSFFLKSGEALDLAALRSQLTLAGYSHVTQVVAPGEYCVRGGLIDLFPTGSALPYRLDLIDEEIESIRSFDPDTQRTLYKVAEIRLLPAREFPMDEAGRNQFRRSFRESFARDPSKSRI